MKSCFIFFDEKENLSLSLSKGYNMKSCDIDVYHSA